MSTTKTLIALTAGVVIGAAAGLLLAPEKGEVLRERIKEQSGDAADRLGKKFNDARDTVKDKVKSGVDEASSVASKAKENVKKATS